VATDDAVGNWLKRLVLVMVCVLLGMCCLFLWSLSMTLYRVERVLAATAGDIKRVAGTVAAVSARVDELNASIDRLAEAKDRLLDEERVQGLLASIREMSESGDDEPMSADAEEEIDSLLRAVRRSKMRFKIKDRDYGAFSFYLWLKGKKAVYPGDVGSAEDFIAKVAGKSITGRDYFAVDAEGNAVPLEDWLTHRLEDLRHSDGEEQTAEGGDVAGPPAERD
jgi:hypothetical protein